MGQAVLGNCSKCLQAMFGHDIGYPLHIIGHIGVETRQADLTAGCHAHAYDAKLHHAHLVLV